MINDNLIPYPEIMIETERLIIMPLNYSQLEKYIRNDNSLEQELKLNDTCRIISEDIKEALEQYILPAVSNVSRNFLYSTLWTIINKDENKMVADLCFVGEPNTAGEIEIGYGTYETFQNKGYMTEALGGIINWAKGRQGLITILASTEKANRASHIVLEKNNFIKYNETESIINWRYELRKL